jgi:serpin B
MRTLVTSLALMSTAGVAVADTKPLVTGEHQLTFDLAKKIAPADNTVFSPASIHIALGMTFAGAKGATADEMAKTLHYGANVHDSFRELAMSLAKLESKDQSFRMANRLFGQAKYDWAKSFLELTDKKYGAGLEPVDFGKPEPVRQRINGWVEDQTNHKIKDLLPKGSLTPYSRMVLTNAVYFKGAWMHQFEKSVTNQTDFAVRGTTKAKVSTMHQQAHLGLGGNADASVLEMPYSHGDIAMDIILPREKNGLTTFESKLDAGALAQLLATVKPAEVEVALPKFKVRSTVQMKDVLEQLGMKKAFAQDADFTGMVGKATQPLWIDQIYHQAFVDVDEAGTEAAAATAVVATTDSAPAPLPATAFHADHPFAWMIRDLKTGEILFYGRVVDPRG